VPTQIAIASSAQSAAMRPPGTAEEKRLIGHQLREIEAPTKKLRQL
jgi:hypothetical protein